MTTYLFAALGLSLFYLIYRIGKQILLTYQCLDEQTLRDFWYGRLKRHEQKHRQVISHLGHCEKCRDRFYEIQKQKGRPIEDHLIDPEEG